MPDVLNSRLFAFITCLIIVWMVLPLPDVAAGKWWVVEINKTQVEVEVVQSAAEQQLGLGNRFSLPSGQGMLFTYNKPGVRVFWMKNMNFPIDIIWFRAKSAVLIEESVPFPARNVPDPELDQYGFGVNADLVLEVPAGFVKQNRIVLGDTIQIVKRD